MSEMRMRCLIAALQCEDDVDKINIYVKSGLTLYCYQGF